MVLSGAVWSVFAFALGGTIALAYGFWVAMIALTIGSIVGTGIAIVITQASASYGLDVDLITRGSGYGFLGSAVTSLIWGAIFLMYAGFEASFMASAFHTQWPGVNINIVYVIMSLIIVPINWYGFVVNDLLQRITWPLFLIGLVWLMIKVFSSGGSHVSVGTGAVTFSALVPAMAAVLTSCTTQGMLVGDWSRFMRKADIPRAKWIAALMAIWLTFVVEGGLGAAMSLFTKNANPGIYAASLLGVGGVLWILVTQLRINNMNYYSSSLALANFSSRILRWVPGRHIWVIATALITIGTTTGRIRNHLLSVLTFLGIFLLAWMGTVFADLLVIKPRLKIGPAHIEHRRGYLTNCVSPSIPASS